MTNFKRKAQRMVELYIASRGITDQRVLDAMAEVPRHKFVDPGFQGIAYGDHALPIGEGQSISNPYTVAKMVESLKLEGFERVLEIGGGSAYQAAILSRLASEVYSVERLSSLASRARKTLMSIGCSNVLFKVGDGTLGWKDKAPFDAIIVGAASPSVPEELLHQVKDGGCVVIPIDKNGSQRLIKYKKRGNKIHQQDIGECEFVPLIGEQGWKEDKLNAQKKL